MSNPAAFSLGRVGAMVVRYTYLLRSSWPRILEMIFWPAVQMLTWSFLQTYLVQAQGVALTSAAIAAGALIGGVLLWDILLRGQQGFFGFNLWALGVAFTAFFVVLIFFAWSVGLLVSGILLRYGLGAENLVWSLMFIIQPLGCVYYPVAALHGWLQPICWALPPTYVFEGLRGVLLDHVLRADFMLTGLAIDLLLFAGAAFGFSRLLASARRAGTLLQMGE